MSVNLPTSSVPKRVDQLHVVFDKALNESINSISGTELKECSAGIESQIGNNLQNVFVNVINNAETRMQESFDNISRLHKLEDIIRTSMNLDNSSKVAGDSTGSADNSAYGVDGVEAQFSALVLAEKQREKERLTTAVQQLDFEIRRTKDGLSRLKAQVQNEIAAAAEECQKMSVAAAQIGHSQVQ